MTFYLLHFLCYAVLTILLLLSRKQCGKSLCEQTLFMKNNDD